MKNTLIIITFLIFLGGCATQKMEVDHTDLYLPEDKSAYQMAFSEWNKKGLTKYSFSRTRLIPYSGSTVTVYVNNGETTSYSPKNNVGVIRCKSNGCSIPSIEQLYKYAISGKDEMAPSKWKCQYWLSRKTGLIAKRFCTEGGGHEYFAEHINWVKH